MVTISGNYLSEKQPSKQLLINSRKRTSRSFEKIDNFNVKIKTSMEKT